MIYWSLLYIVMCTFCFYRLIEYIRRSFPSQDAASTNQKVTVNMCTDTYFSTGSLQHISWKTMVLSRSQRRETNKCNTWVKMRFALTLTKTAMKYWVNLYRAILRPNFLSPVQQPHSDRSHLEQMLPVRVDSDLQDQPATECRVASHV